jgi:hypothetical protein
VPPAEAAAECGNGKVEDGEACDGGGACETDCRPIEGLIHRYAFDQPGSTARDSVGAAHAMIVGVTKPMPGIVSLSGGQDQYIELPAGVLSGLQDLTIEARVNWRDSRLPGGQRATGTWERVFDFGSNVLASTGAREGTSYLFLTVNGDWGRPRLVYSDRGPAGEVWAEAAQPFTANEWTHIAAVLDTTRQRLLLYIDGELVGSGWLRGAMPRIDDRNNWLGKSQYEVDRNFAGSFDELRIYDRALSSEVIKAHASAQTDP